MGELDFQGSLLKNEEGCTFVVWRLGWRELLRATQFRRPWGGRLGKWSRWGAFVEATWGRDRLEVTSTEHFCFLCPRLCAYNILAHDQLEGKLQEGETWMLSLPRNPHHWEQSGVPSGPSATTCRMHVIFTEALQGMCYHSHLQMRKLMLWEVESFSQVSQWMRAKISAAQKAMPSVKRSQSHPYAILFCKVTWFCPGFLSLLPWGLPTFVMMLSSSCPD